MKPLGPKKRQQLKCCILRNSKKFSTSLSEFSDRASRAPTQSKAPARSKLSSSVVPSSSRTRSSKISDKPTRGLFCASRGAVGAVRTELKKRGCTCIEDQGEYVNRECTYTDSNNDGKVDTDDECN